MIGKCDSCGKERELIKQTNFRVVRKLCKECCRSANNVEIYMSKSKRILRHLNILKS